MALKGATPEMREKVFRNMSSRAAKMLVEDMQAMGPVRLRDATASRPHQPADADDAAPPRRHSFAHAGR